MAVRLQPWAIPGVELFMKASSVGNASERGWEGSGNLRVLTSGSAIVLQAAWLYLLAWGALLAAAVVQPDGGGWEFEGWVLTGALLGPIVLIPIYLACCAKRKLTPRFRHWLPWVVRVSYVSMILAICDSWAAGTERREPLFSKVTWGMSDGGTRGCFGFGYSLTYHRKMGGEHGPEVWFWFSPFTVRWTSEHVGLRWIWQSP